MLVLMANRLDAIGGQGSREQESNQIGESEYLEDDDDQRGNYGGESGSERRKDTDERSPLSAFFGYTATP